MSHTTKKMLEYSNKLILAPMVRVGTLPMRLLALRYGADIVYGEEIIDHKILQCKRIENKLLGTIDYMTADGSVIFRTCEEEKSQLVFQMGTCDPERALKVGKILEKDLSGLDINMGCPKEFSIKGGMGAALLTQPERIQKILTALVNGLSIPVTCKIRILPKLSDTINLVKMIETTGVKALGVHGRWKEERSSLPCHCDYIREIRKNINIPVIANGGSLNIDKYEDIEQFKSETGCSSVMLARAAQWNPSVFRKEGSLPIKEMLQEYLKIAIKYDYPIANVKYVLCVMLRDTSTKLGQKLLAAITHYDMSVALDLQEYYNKIITEREKQQQYLDSINSEITNPKRLKLDDNHIVLDIAYNRKYYTKTSSPIQILHEYCMKEDIGRPVFNTVMDSNRLYKSVLTLRGKTYTNILFDKRKKSAEQAAAIVFLKYHNIDDGRIKT